MRFGRGLAPCWDGTTPIWTALLAPKNLTGSFQPSGLPLGVCACRSTYFRRSGSPVKMVRNALCTLEPATSSPSVHISATLSTNSLDLTCKSHRAQYPQIGRERPHFLAANPPKNFVRVAPARHAGSVTVFCPRAYTDVINPECREEAIPISERRKSRWQY